MAKARPKRRRNRAGASNPKRSDLIERTSDRLGTPVTAADDRRIKEINVWMTRNWETNIEVAKQNTKRLTGKPVI